MANIEKAKNNDLISSKINPLNPALYEYRIYTKRNKPLEEDDSFIHSLVNVPGVVNLINEITKKTGTEFIAQLTEEETRKLKLGIYKMAGKKGLLAQLRDGETGEIIKQIKLQERNIPNGSVEALSDFSTHVQVQQLAGMMEEVLNGISSIQQGQRNDRIGLFYSARQKYIESQLISNEDLKLMMLQSAISTATDARMQMMTTLFSDLDELADNRKLKKKEKDEIQYQIHMALECINDCTLISALSYLALNEEPSCISTLESYQAFVEQAFLEVHRSGMTYAEIMHDNLKINNDVWLKKPGELIGAVSTTIENISRNEIPFNNILMIEDYYNEIDSNKETEVAYGKQ